MTAHIVYIAVFCRIVGNPEDGYSTEYSTDGLRYNYSDVAKNETEAQYGHDDFLVAQVRDQQLLAIVDNVGGHDTETVAQHLGLDYFAPIAGWSMARPEAAGAYYVRGWWKGVPFAEALVEIMTDERGQLVCNLHRSNVEQDTHLWLVVSEMFGDLEWKGPLLAEDEMDVRTHAAVLASVESTAKEIAQGLVQGALSQIVSSTVYEELYKKTMDDAKDAMDYVQQNSEKFGARPGDDKLAIVCREFLRLQEKPNG